MLLFRDTDPVPDRDLVLKRSSLWKVRDPHRCWLPRSQNTRLRSRCTSRGNRTERRRPVGKRFARSL